MRIWGCWQRSGARSLSLVDYGSQKVKNLRRSHSAKPDTANQPCTKAHGGDIVAPSRLRRANLGSGRCISRPSAMGAEPEFGGCHAPARRGLKRSAPKSRPGGLESWPKASPQGRAQRVRKGIRCSGSEQAHAYSLYLSSKFRSLSDSAACPSSSSISSGVSGF